MLSKKTALIGAVIALINLPLHANATSLTTINNTDEFSAVRVTSGTVHPCSGTPSGQYTPPRDKSTGEPGKLETSWNMVKFLCMTSGSVCTADIYMTKDCTGPVIATASLDLNNPNVVAQSIDPKYVVIANGTQVALNYTS